jgi:hypothetical protein
VHPALEGAAQIRQPNNYGNRDGGEQADCRGMGSDRGCEVDGGEQREYQPGRGSPDT